MPTQKRIIIWCAVSSDSQATDEKESLPDQLRRQRERAARNNWQVIDEIIIEGFSRRYYTFAEFANAAAEAGHVDALRMFNHWLNRDFDILSCRDLSRLGREQSILNEVIARTIDCGAIIMPLDESPVDSINYRMVGAIGGVGAAQHIDSMKKGRNMGMIARAARGEQVSWRVPMFYILNDAKQMIPNRATYQRFFDDVAELFLLGTSYERIPYELETRGHVNVRTGRRYDKTTVKRLLLSARTWGNSEFNRTGLKRGHHTLLAENWITGRGEPPAGVFFQRDTCEPIWDGDTKERMIDELERRFYAIRGAARPNATYALSQLCVCDKCGANMVIQNQRPREIQYYYLKCPKGRQSNVCDNKTSIRWEPIQDFLSDLINALLANPEAALSDNERPKPSRLPAIDRDITKLTTRIDNLIDLISEAAPGNRADYQAKIDTLTTQRDALRLERIRAERETRERDAQLRSRATSLDELRALGVSNLWTLPTTQANQILRKVLGNWRVAVYAGEVRGLVNVDA